MKQLFSLFAVLLLVGGGCAAAPTTDTETDVADEAMMEETHEDSDSMMAEDDSEDADDSMEAELESDEDDDADQDETTDLEETETVTIELDEGTSVDVEVEAEDETEVTEITIGGATDVELNMESGNFFFSPSTISAETGAQVGITFTANSGFHTFVIDEVDVRFEINEGERLVFTAPSEPGSYVFYCDIGSHQALGMEGVLIVE